MAPKWRTPAPVGDPPVNTYATPPHHATIIPSARGQSQGAIGTPEAFTGKPIGCMENLIPAPAYDPERQR
jgi:hypothetical protein